MALYQPYSFSPKKTLRGGKTKHTMPAADFASALSGLLSIFSVSAWSVLMAVQKHILHDALHSCVGSGIGFSRYLFSCISGNTANKYLWARQLTRSSLHKNAFAEPVEYLASLQRYSLLASSHLEDLAARQLPSPAHPMPFLSLPCASPGNAISMQLRYQHSPPYHWISEPWGPPYFIALFLFLLCWWCLGQEP